MKVISALFFLMSFNVFADCTVDLKITDSVIGGGKPTNAAREELEKKGYTVVSTAKEARYSLRLNRITAMYEGNGPGFFEKDIDALNGEFADQKTAEVIDVSEFSEVRFLGLRRSSSFKKNVKTAIATLPSCLV